MSIEGSDRKDPNTSPNLSRRGFLGAAAGSLVAAKNVIAQTNAPPDTVGTPDLKSTTEIQPVHVERVPAPVLGSGRIFWKQIEENKQPVYGPKEHTACVAEMDRYFKSPFGRKN